MTAVLILVIIAALVWMETTGTAVNVLQASQVLTAGSVSVSVALYLDFCLARILLRDNHLN